MINNNQNTFTVPHKAKWAFTTRRVNHADVKGITHNLSGVVSGDLVVAEVLKINSHAKIQLTTGRPSILNTGDYVVLCCGDRYAPDQFEGRATLNAEASDMLAGGGVIGTAIAAHASMKPPTQLRPLGLLTDDAGEIINIASYRIPDQNKSTNLKVIGVVGASMNAGKTTATASLAHGLVKAGYKTAGIKATGTGAFGDYNAMQDANLDYVADFTDAGMVTTYLQPIDRIENGLLTLLAEAKNNGAEIAIVELADGIFQKETARLLSESFIVKSNFDGFMFASGDAVSAVGGVQHLRSLGIEPLAVSGKVSLSPLAVSEAEAQAGVKIYTREQLMDPEIATAIAESTVAIKQAG